MEFFCRSFFSKSFRVDSVDFHDMKNFNIGETSLLFSKHFNCQLTFVENLMYSLKISLNFRRLVIRALF